jgi:hypothetical protein
VTSERGHVGVSVASLLALAGMIVLAIGLGRDSSTVAVVGAVLLGLGSLIGMNAPHIWMRSVYRRLDRVSPNDPEASKSFRLEF